MNQFIPYEKLSKKEKRKLNAAKRTVWDICPVTRRPENPKAYNRKKTRREFRDDSPGASSALSCFMTPFTGFFLCLQKVVQIAEIRIENQYEKKKRCSPVFSGLHLFFFITDFCTPRG